MMYPRDERETVYFQEEHQASWPEYWEHQNYLRSDVGEVLLAASTVSSPLSNCFSNLNRAAASLILKQSFTSSQLFKLPPQYLLNSIQKAWTSMNSSWTLIILFLMRDWRKTQTSLTSLFCMYLQYRAVIADRGSCHDILVLYSFTRWDTVWDVEVDKLGWELHRCGQPVDDLHTVQAHLHVHCNVRINSTASTYKSLPTEHREIFRNLTGSFLH